MRHQLADGQPHFLFRSPSLLLPLLLLAPPPLPHVPHRPLCPTSGPRLRAPQRRPDLGHGRVVATLLRVNGREQRRGRQPFAHAIPHE
eukprot:3440424-Rhodomonas_salina.1